MNFEEFTKSLSDLMDAANANGKEITNAYVSYHDYMEIWRGGKALAKEEIGFMPYPSPIEVMGVTVWESSFVASGGMFLKIAERKK